jgi:transcriptional regulator with AAA-type ATPase domain
MPPEQAIATLRQLVGDSPEMIQVLDQIEAMPPEDQGAAIQQLLEAISANV